jgi:hypothetical protein
MECHAYHSILAQKTTDFNTEAIILIVSIEMLQDSG